MTTLDTSPPLDADATTRIREIVGVFLCCARAINNTMFMALSNIALQQASATEALVEKHKVPWMRLWLWLTRPLYTCALR